MKSKLNFTIIQLFLCFLSVSGSENNGTVKIICEMKGMEYWSFYRGNLLTCFTGGLTKVLTKDVIVDNGIKDNSIEAIYFQSSSEIHFIPQGLKENYPKLKAVYFETQPTLKSLSDRDLEQFGSDLEWFGVRYSKVSLLKKNLFRHNTNLKWIDFYKNPLQVIEPGFFDNISKMEKLVAIVLQGCSCIDESRVKPNIRNSTWSHNCNNQSARSV